MSNPLLTVEINNLKGLKNLKIGLNLSPDIYAITGINGSGKSTLMSSLSSLFYRKTLSTYFHNSYDADSFIRFSLAGNCLKITPEKPYWRFFSEVGTLPYIHGFYEGSIIHGNRFRDANFKALFQASKVKTDQLIKADDFVVKNLGKILRNNENAYSSLYRLKSADALKTFRFNGSPYFVVLENGKLISQYSLSTGENLLISILHSMQHQLPKSKTSGYYLFLLDEVELALHPSALVRLIDFLKGMSKEKGFSIYFSTHSIELLRLIPPANIYHLHRHLDNTVEVIHPCFPAYAARSLYIPDRYDIVIFVEDELARKIVWQIIQKYHINKSKLIHIQPCGGWLNVLSFHQDSFSSNLLGYNAVQLSILDGDIEKEYRDNYLNKGKYDKINIAFLPIKSMEKYLRSKLVDNVDYEFFRDFGDRFYNMTSLEAVLERYQPEVKTDKAGKGLLKLLLSSINKSDFDPAEFLSHIAQYIIEHEDMESISKRIVSAIR